MSSIDVLIPTRSDFRSAIRVVQEMLAQKTQHQVQIFVSVSDPLQFELYKCALSEYTSVVLLPSDNDLSLYGNFRRLIHHSNAEWVTICADDDKKSPDFLESAVLVGERSAASLVIPRIELRRYDRGALEFGEIISAREAQPAEGHWTLTAKDAWPTWIFGLWSGPLLREFMPHNDFDWLDCALIHRALGTHTVEWLPSAQPLICGYDPGRQSWSVTGTGEHFLEGWKNYSKEFMKQLRPLDRLLWRWHVTRSMNANLISVNSKII